MGAHWLHSLPAEAAARGLHIRTWAGWETRSRISGGFDDIRGVLWHHTASPTSWTSNQNCSYIFNSAPLAPISSLYLGRAGDVTIGAAGAANHAGTGGPYTTSRGHIPLDRGNAYLIGIEAGNTGTGERWPQAQIDAYDRLTEILCEVYGLNPQQDVIFHSTWAPDRKIDPSGPTLSRPSWGGTSGNNKWNLVNVRRDLNSAPTPPDDDDMTPIKPQRVYDSQLSGGAFAPGEIRRVPVVFGDRASIGGGCKGGKGWWGYSPDGDFSNPTSFVNLVDDGNWYSWGAIPVLAPGGHVYIRSHAGGHIYIDTYAQ